MFGMMRAIVRVRRRMRGPLLPSWDDKLETWSRFLHHYAKRSTGLSERNAFPVQIAHHDGLVARVGLNRFELFPADDDNERE